MTISAVVTETEINASVTQLSNSVALTETEINASVSQTPISANVTSSPVSASVTAGTSISVAVSQNTISASISSSGGGVTDHALLSNLSYALSGHTGFQATLTADVDYLTPATAALTYQPIGSYLTDAPSDGTTYGRNNGAWTAVSSGVTNHALLSNLDYASAGHTGFQSALTFPLAANLGGTGIANLAGSTLTLGGATTISTGGTIALGGFTLTVPATGTAALLATANVFTVPQMIDLAADGIGLTIQAASGQTSNNLVIETSTGTDLLSVDATGRIVHGATSTNNATASHNFLATVLTIGTNFTNGDTIVYDFTGALINTALITRNLFGAKFAAVLATGATGDNTGSIVGGQFRTQLGSSSSVYVNDAIGGDFLAVALSNRASWAKNNALAGRFGINLQSNAAHTTALAASLYITSHIKNANITITNGYGLYVENINVAATNYAIYTNAGLNRFGDQVSIVGSADRNQLTVTGFTTQTNPVAHIIDDTAATAVVRNVLQLEARSTGTVAANFGVGLPFYAETATDGTYQQQGLISTSWIDATNVSRKAKMSLSAYDTAARLGIEIEADGSAAKLGFYGVTTVARQVLATGAGATADDIITALQNLGLVSQS